MNWHWIVMAISTENTIGMWSQNKNSRIIYGERIKQETQKKIRKDEYGENYDFSFVRDRNFSLYEVLKNSDSYKIVLKDSMQEKVLAQLELNNPTWKYINDENELFIVDHPSIYKLSNGVVSMMANDISSSRVPFSFVNEEHNIYGIWTDRENKIYVAQYGGREIRCINAQGEITRVAKSGFLWSPVNGLFDNYNNLWVMECKIGGKIRVRKIPQNELSNNSSFFIEHIIFTAILLLLTALIFWKLKVYSGRSFLELF